jgi:hypothetical protein
VNVEDARSSLGGEQQPPPSRKDGGGQPRGTPPSVVAGRLVLLFAAAAALVSGIVHARSHDRESLAMEQPYVCPMHPEIKSRTPGDCPICNMALVPMSETERGTLGMASDGQVVATARERMVARQTRAAAWVGRDGKGSALLYKDDLAGLVSEAPARFFGGRSPNMPLDAHLITAEQAPGEGSTVNVAFRLDQPAEHAMDGASSVDVGSLQIDVTARKLLVVPTSAVLYSARGPYVLARRGEGEGFAKRVVQVGRILDSGYVGALAGRQEGSTVILSGIREGETVIAGYTFFEDVERRLHEARAAGGKEAMR